MFVNVGRTLMIMIFFCSGYFFADPLVAPTMIEGNSITLNFRDHFSKQHRLN